MCTNRALVDSLECYMDDLVDSFEDFVKKSLILISVGVATVVVMLLYMLKVISDRSATPGVGELAGQPVRRCRSNTSIPSTTSKCSSSGSSRRNCLNSDFMLCEPIPACASVNTVPLSTYDERLLRDIGFSNCNKNCELKARSYRTVSPPRISIPSLPTYLQKQPLSPRNCVKLLKRTSCCSMCCDEDKSIDHIL